MNHEEQLILYVTDQLNDAAERLNFEKHLADCAECQADLQLWKAVADEIIASNSTEPVPVKSSGPCPGRDPSTTRLNASLSPRCAVTAFADLPRPA
ncbi:MAG: hypothetical protein QM730_22070 [Anaerolineales bacterium]